MSDIKITLDKNVNWDSQDLGVFDGSSSLADNIDSDNNGVITKSELESYQKSHKSYSVIEKADAPKNYDELKDLMDKTETAYNSMEQEAQGISVDNATFMSQLNSLIDAADSASALQHAKTNANSIEQLSKDFDTTSSNVKKALDEAKKKGISFCWFGDTIINNVSNKLKDKSEEVKKNIESVHKDVDITEKTAETKLKKTTPEKKTTKTENV